MSDAVDRSKTLLTPSSVTGATEAREDRASSALETGVENDGEDALGLELGDFVTRIPHYLLAPGPHDFHRLIYFDLREIAVRIARGESTIPIVEIYRRAPDIFRGQIQASDNVQVRFPWLKVLSLITQSDDASAEESLAARLRKKRVEQPPVVTPPSKPAISAPPPPKAVHVPYHKRSPAVNSATWYSPAEKKGAQAEAPAERPYLSLASDAAKLAILSTELLDYTIPAMVTDAQALRAEMVKACEAGLEKLERMKREHDSQIAHLQSEARELLAERDEALRRLSEITGNTEMPALPEAVSAGLKDL